MNLFESNPWRSIRAPWLFVATCFFVLAFAPPGAAFEIEIQMNGYPGRWRVDDLDLQTGDASLDLAPGDHVFKLWNVETTYADITVDDGGDVSSSEPSKIRRVARGRLELVTHPIVVDVNGYSGRWRSGADTLTATSLHQENQTLRLAAATYRFSLYQVSDAANEYTVTAGGTVETEGELLRAAGARLMLVPYLIEVDIGG